MCCDIYCRGQRRTNSQEIRVFLSSVADSFGAGGCSVPDSRQRTGICVHPDQRVSIRDEGGEGATGEVEVLISAEQTPPNGYEPLVDALHVANVRTGMGNHNYTNFQGYFMILIWMLGSILTVSHQRCALM